MKESWLLRSRAYEIKANCLWNEGLLYHQKRGAQKKRTICNGMQRNFFSLLNWTPSVEESNFSSENRWRKFWRHFFCMKKTHFFFELLIHHDWRFQDMKVWWNSLMVVERCMSSYEGWSFYMFCSKTVLMPFLLLKEPAPLQENTLLQTWQPHSEKLPCFPILQPFPVGWWWFVSSIGCVQGDACATQECLVIAVTVTSSLPACQCTVALEISRSPGE